MLHEYADSLASATAGRHYHLLMLSCRLLACLNISHVNLDRDEAQLIFSRDSQAANLICVQTSSDLRFYSTMRLLRTDSWENGPKLKLVEFQGDARQPYAILSHTWEDEEVVYADVSKEDVCLKLGYQKLYYAMKQAQEDGFEYLWVDTCCIDKSSSSELSEAINSMYYWYQHAAVCYAYLSDVTVSGRNFQKSRWFTRGWTLQELLAPDTVIFYSQTWEWLGDKLSLAAPISQATGIGIEFLDGRKPVAEASVAKRLFWASARETTRIEDMAYSLLGVFSVSMPLLYGERERAFLRLQEEIIKVTDDQTIFVWKDPVVNEASTRRGLLAESPSYFAESARFVSCRDVESKEPHSMNNGRMKVELRFISGLRDGLRDGHKTYGLLSCIDEADPENLIAINLELTSSSRQEYQRILCHEMWPAKYLGTLKSIFVPQNATFLDLRPLLPRPPDISILLRDLDQPARIGASAQLLACSSPRQTKSGVNWDGEDLGQKARKTARGWVPTVLPIYFVAPSFAATPIVALHFTILKMQITVLLGTTSTMQIGCCAVQGSDSHQFDAFRDLYVPSTNSMLLAFRSAQNNGYKLTWSATPYKCAKLEGNLCYIVDFAFKTTSRVTVPSVQNATAIKEPASD